MWELVIAGIGALANYNAQMRANKARERAFQMQLEQDRKNRALAKRDAANKFVDMSNAAEKAGINRLTALRATGGVGFGNFGGYTAQVPVLSKQSFAETFGGAMLKTYAQNKINAPLDKYNAEIRQLELEQRGLDIKMARTTLNNMSVSGVGGVGDLGEPRKGNNPKSGERTSIEIAGAASDPADMSDAELAEQRYGDIVQEIYGMSVLVADGFKNGLLALKNLEGNKPGFNSPERAEIIRKAVRRQEQRRQQKYTGALSLGPNFRDRMGIMQPYYNY
jgi:hypothetical protein